MEICIVITNVWHFKINKKVKIRRHSLSERHHFADSSFDSGFVCLLLNQRIKMMKELKECET